MLTIRLQRVGKKHQPSFRVVVSERRSKLGGPPIEDLGFYNPFTKEASLKKERIEHWKKEGAHLTPTVHNLCVGKGILKEPKIIIKLNKPKAKEAVATTAAPAAEAKEAAPAEAPAA